MTDFLTSNRRFLAAHRGTPADRVPILSPISWSPGCDIEHDLPGGWRSDSNFVKVAKMVEVHCDPVPAYGPQYPKVWAQRGYQRFLEVSDEYVEQLPVEQVGSRRRHTSVLHTPHGDLRHTWEAEEGIETSWDVEKPIKTTADVERLLSVPYRFNPPPAKDYEPFRQYRAKMGRDFLTGGGVNSMVAFLCGNMSFELLLEWIATEPALVKELADAWLERSREKVEFMLAQGVGPYWHFNGVERASPPMMGPKHWEQWVVPYDGAIMRLIKERQPDAIIHVHCHGRVGTLLDSFIAMGVDSIDPVEPPPQGDVEIGDAKRRAAGRLTMFGNIQFLDMERCTPDEIEQKVRHAIEDGGKDHMVLCPSSTPHERHTDRFTANAIRYIEAGLKYGRK